MSKIRSLRAGLLVGCLMMVLLVFGIAFKDKKKHIVLKPEATEHSSDHAGIELKNVNYSTLDEKNIKQWDLKAETAKYFKDRNMVKLKALFLNIYHLEGKTYTLSSDYGELDTETRDIKLKGNVDAVLPDKTVVRSDTFFYDHKKQIITTNDKVLIIQQKFTMEGQGIRVDLEKEKLTILNKVRARESR